MWIADVKGKKYSFLSADRTFGLIVILKVKYVLQEVFVATFKSVRGKRKFTQRVLSENKKAAKKNWSHLFNGMVRMREILWNPFLMIDKYLICFWARAETSIVRSIAPGSLTSWRPLPQMVMWSVIPFWMHPFEISTISLTTAASPAGQENWVNWRSYGDW